YPGCSIQPPPLSPLCPFPLPLHPPTNLQPLVHSSEITSTSMEQSQPSPDQSPPRPYLLCLFSFCEYRFLPLRNAHLLRDISCHCSTPRASVFFSTTQKETERKRARARPTGGVRQLSSVSPSNSCSLSISLPLFFLYLLLAHCLRNN
uniref:Uncharacterized protein n=1 Tax=Seriola lalandi dorsalis TaxID=1841481 RepID=A0A3B4XC25_SERLL